MEITARGLNRASLRRQLLLERSDLEPSEAVRQVVAVQAQSPASPYLALWNRVDGFDAGALDAAFADRTLVKSNHMRMTLHVSRLDDYRRYREATEPSLRAAKLGHRFAETGLTPADAERLVPRLLAFADRPRTVADCKAWMAERIDVDVDAAWWGLRQYAPLWHAVTGAPWSFGDRPSYIAADRRPDPEAAEAALQELARRYLAGFGPATAADLAQFALVQRGRAKAAFEAITAELIAIEGPQGRTLYDLPGAPLPDRDTPAPPRLMAMWDNLLLAYSDRSRVIPSQYRKHAVRVNGDVLPTILVDGYVAGVWRPLGGRIEVTAFHRLAEADWAGLRAESEAMATFLADRDPEVYRRYHHWWPKLPAEQVKVL